MNPLVWYSDFLPHIFLSAENRKRIGEYQFAGKTGDIFSLKPHENPLVRNPWELFLANARAKFIGELYEKNEHLLLAKDSIALHGDVFEIDSGMSLLTPVLERQGIQAIKRSPERFLDNNSYQGSTFGFVVSHTQLEHCASFDDVTTILNKAGEIAQYGMIHQVHAVDDPGFSLDPSHKIFKTRKEWDAYFEDWADQHAEEGWVYAGKHQGASTRPYNFVLERNGNLPFYKQYDKQVMRQVVHELTVANGISFARAPLLLLSFALEKNMPAYFLPGMIIAIHALDAADGAAARALGPSPVGEHVDYWVDHGVEMMALIEYAYKRKAIPKYVPWVISTRNISTDLIRIVNACKYGLGNEESHPHESLGTKGKSGRRERVLYGGTKLIGHVAIPVFPKLGLYISHGLIAASLVRAQKVWNSDRSKELYADIMQSIMQRKL